MRGSLILACLAAAAACRRSSPPGGGGEGPPAGPPFFVPIPLKEPFPARRRIYEFGLDRALDRILARLPGGTTRRAWLFAKAFLARNGHEALVIEKLGAFLDTWLLGGRDPAPLINALEVMRESGDPRYDRWIRKALGHPKATVQSAALAALERCARPETVAALLARFEELTPASQIGVLRIAVRRGRSDDVVPFLKAVLEGERAPARTPLLRSALLKVCEEARRPALVRAVLSGELGRFRGGEALVAARLLHEAGGEEGRAWLLRALGRARDAVERAAVVEALGLRDPGGSLPRVVGLLERGGPSDRVVFARFLRAVPDEKAVPLLEVLLHDDDVSVRRAAAEALRGRRSPALVRLVEDLRTATGSNARLLLELAVAARVPELVPIVERRLTAAEDGERRALLQALGRSRLPGAVPVLLAEVAGPSRLLSRVKEIESVGYAAMMLANIPEALEPVWRTYLDLRDDEVRRSHLLGTIANLAHLDPRRDSHLAVAARAKLRRVLYDPKAPLRDRLQVLGFLEDDLTLADWRRLKQAARRLAEEPQGFAAAANDLLWALF